MDEQPKPCALAVSNLLMVLFSVEECRHFLMKYHPDLLPEAPGAVASPQLFFDTVSLALIRRGLLTEAFLDNLQRERPYQAGEIDKLRHSLHLQKTTLGPPQVGFHFRGRLQDLSVEMLTQVIALLRLQTGDSSLVAVDLRVGSIKILVEAQRETCDRLLSLSLGKFNELHYKLREDTNLRLWAIRPAGWFFEAKAGRKGFGTPVAALEDLLRHLFSPVELHVFLRRTQAPYITDGLGELSQRLPPRSFAFEVAEALRGYGEVQNTLESMLAERPRRREEIIAVMELWDEYYNEPYR